MDVYNRARNVAIWGAVLEAVFAGVMLGVWLWTGAASALPALALLGGGFFVWLMVALLFYCRQLERAEQRELDEIAARGGPEAGIFEGEAEGEVRPAAARLMFFDRWVVPAFTLLWAGYHATLGILLIRYVRGLSVSPLTNPAEAAVFLVIAGFLGFLLSRYATGMSREAHWRLLRGPGSYLLVSVLVMVAVLSALIAAWQGVTKVDLVVAHVIPAIQIVLAVELVINFILDLYRPRVPHAEPLASFDSRLFALLAEPERIGTSVAEALNYQFGFEVSRTWFYQLLSRAFVPLILFGVLVLFAMSSVVIVQEGQECVVLHWGKAPGRDVLGPGLHVKWPWPVDTVRRFETGRMHEIMLGAGAKRTREEREEEFVKGRELYLWTAEHGPRKELDFLVAVAPSVSSLRARRTEQPPPPVHVIKLLVAMQYEIEDVYKYALTYTDPEKLLEDIAWGQMTRYCASATLDQPVPAAEGARPEAIMTFGRDRAAEELQQRIQEAVGPEGVDLGVRVVSVDFIGVHPPSEAAPAYEEVLQEERRQEQRRYEAEADANRMLAEAAGDPAAALRLAFAIRALEQLESLQTLQGRPEEFRRRIDQYVRLIGEDIAIVTDRIARQRLLGKTARGGEQTEAERLRAAYEDHLELLRAIASAAEREADFPLGELIAEARRRADELFDQALGKPSALVAQARAGRWEREMSERGRADAFQSELLAFRASPRIYMLDRWLDVWDRVLPGITKYVLGVDRDKIEIWLNAEQEMETIEGTLTRAEAARQAE